MLTYWSLGHEFEFNLKWSFKKMSELPDGCSLRWVLMAVLPGVLSSTAVLFLFPNQCDGSSL